MKIDLNCDLGESFGPYKIGESNEIMKYISSANIACGFHGGDPLVMYDTVKRAIENRVQIGAHPGLPDLLGFGRREMKISPHEAKCYMLYQVGSLNAIVKSLGAKLEHVKLHGAFYNMVSRDYELSKAIMDGLIELGEDIVLYALSGSILYNLAVELNYPVKSEVFADRTYTSDGKLTPRSMEASIIKDSNMAIERMIDILKTKKCKSIDGYSFDIMADTICVHGDSEDALNFTRAMYESLLENGFEVSAK